jgi:hypothetical protein
MTYDDGRSTLAEKLSANETAGGLDVAGASDFITTAYVSWGPPASARACPGQVPGFAAFSDCKHFCWNELRCQDLSANHAFLSEVSSAPDIHPKVSRLVENNLRWQWQQLARLRLRPIKVNPPVKLDSRGIDICRP